MGRTTTRVGWMVLALLALVLTGCTQSPPGCTAAQAELDVGRLGAAAEAFAIAERAGEGDCAASGSRAVASRYLSAYDNVAQGRAAEDARDVERASTAYQAALDQDESNPSARAGLERLAQPLPPLAEPPVLPTPEPAPAPVTPAAPAEGLQFWLLVATCAAAVLAVVLLVVLLLRRARPAAADPSDAHTAVVLEEVVAVRKRLDEAAGTLKAGDESYRAGHRAAHGALRGRLDELREDVGDLVSYLEERLPDRTATHDHVGTRAEETPR